MFIRLFTIFTLLALPLLIITSMSFSAAAALNYSATALKIMFTDDTFSGEKVKPVECNGITLDNDIITGNGVFSDTTGSSTLLVGTESANTIYGLDGDDCIVAADGHDKIDGGDGFDVCLGGNGDDEFSYCEICYGGDGSDTDLTATCTISSSVESP